MLQRWKICLVKLVEDKKMQKQSQPQENNRDDV